ncbi:MAG: Dihydroorotase [Firmicutes bacterium]|nr:Dihydroorotase [Bacillota bacterium]MDI6705354.1 dihydroorotase [Bacillota bacterium]
MEKLLIKGGRVVDPSSSTDAVLDVLVEGNKIVLIGKDIEGEGFQVVDAGGKLVFPGLVDMHVHLREPGQEHKETIESGTRSAAAGGFTTIACMPNTDPVIDTPAMVEYIKLKAEKAGYVKVKPVAAITKGLKGEELSPIGELVQYGAVAFSDDGRPVMNSRVMRRAMEYSSMWDVPIISHCEDTDLSGDGHMNEGEMSTVLGMRGIPAIAEEVMVARDIAIARFTGARVHIAHVSTAGSVELVRRAKAEGVRVTAEATPHHFSLTDRDVDGYSTNTKVNPPLRTYEDVEAVKQGLRDGTIDAIATDHAPHHRDDKEVEYAVAAFGISGLETALSLAVTNLLNSGILTPIQLAERMSTAPARILGIEAGCLKEGGTADITVIDPDIEYVVDVNAFKSKGKNSPFDGMSVRGKAVYTIVDGIIKNI